jgi:hypothetical protein
MIWNIIRAGKNILACRTLLETLVLCGTLLLGVSAGFINFFKEFDMLYPCAYCCALLQNAA